MPLTGSSPVMALRMRLPSASSMMRSAQALDLNLKSTVRTSFASVSRLLDRVLELVAGVESGHAAGFDRDQLAGAGVAPRAGRLGADLEVAEARNLDVLPLNQAVHDQVKEGIDHVLGLALVQANLLEQ